MRIQNDLETRHPLVSGSPPHNRRIWDDCALLFFPWYNTEHHHAGLGLLTPAVVHHGDAGPMRTERQAVLTAAYAAHPERFVRKPPTPPALPAAVWINAPGPSTLTLEAQHEGRRVMDEYRIPYVSYHAAPLRGLGK